MQCGRSSSNGESGGRGMKGMDTVDGKMGHTSCNGMSSRWRCASRWSGLLF